MMKSGGIYDNASRCLSHGRKLRKNANDFAAKRQIELGGAQSIPKV
jgi:hypothetical protein